MIKPIYYKTLVVVLIFNFLSFSIYSQITGRITDINNKPLANVNIYVENSYNGTTSNAEGNYTLQVSSAKKQTIVFKYLGYQTEKRLITLSSEPSTLNITLQEERVSLDEVILNSDVNPANRIIKAAISNRKKILASIKEYKTDFYSRGFIKLNNVPKTIMGREVGDLDGSLDSTRSGIIYLSETFSKINFRAPDDFKERIIASKVSGDDNGFSFNTAMDVDFNFYKNTVELGNQIVSPISDYAFNYYQYELDGVFYDDKGHLINKVTVIPKRSNDRVFSGSIYIVEDQWSIYALELNITGQQAQIPIADNIVLTQTHSYAKDEQLWALISQQIDFTFGIFKVKGKGRFNGVYSNYDFNPQFESSQFGPEVLSFEQSANKKDSLFWKTLRPIPLTNEESGDYIRKDSLQVVRQSKTYLDSIDTKNNRFKIINLISGYDFNNSYKKTSFSASGLLAGLNYNTVQGFNNNMRFNFTKKIDEFKHFLSINAKLSYGLSDKQFRGVIYASYKFNDIDDQTIQMTGGITTEQFNRGAISPFINSISTLFFEDNYMKLYEKQFVQFTFSREIMNGFNFYSSLTYQYRSPLFNTTDYTFLNESGDKYTSNNPLDTNLNGVSPFKSHQILTFDISTRIRFGQRYFSYPKSKFNTPNKRIPTIYLNYQKGFAASKKQYHYDHIQLRLSQNITLGNKGDLKYQLKAGHFFNADDIAFMDFQHFNGNQTKIGTSNTYINIFNNLPYYSLSTNRQYIETHIEYDFKGFILNKIPLVKKLNYNLVFGVHTLATPEQKLYQEYSVGIDNIGFKKLRFLRLDYVRSYQDGYQSGAVIFGLKFLNFIQ